MSTPNRPTPHQRKQHRRREYRRLDRILANLGTSRKQLSAEVNAPPKSK